MDPVIEYFLKLIMFWVLVAILYLIYKSLSLLFFYLYEKFFSGFFANNQQNNPPLEVARAVHMPPPRALEDSDRIVFDTYTKENSKEDGGGCAICLEEYKDGETRAAIRECNHRFHAVCIKAWLGRNNNCPLCRTQAV